MGDGRALAVPHPEFIAIAPTGRIAVTLDDLGSPEVVDVFMIQSIEYLSRKGRQPRRKAG